MWRSAGRRRALAAPGAAGLVARAGRRAGVATATLALLAAVGSAGGLAVSSATAQARAAADGAPIPRTPGWELVMARCQICHGLELAVQQRQGPAGWGAILDRMISYGPLVPASERATLLAYLLRHFNDPEGR